MKRTRIVGIGSYAPEKVLTNFDLEKMVDTSNEWIIERTGIKERRIAGKDEAASDLAYEASQKALKSAGIKASDIDLIILASTTPDMFFPSSACFLQNRLGAQKAAAFDISAACSGFIYALSIADQFIKGGAYKTILVVGAEVLSRTTDWNDRTTCVLFGDGAGAAILQPSGDERGIISTHLHSDGAFKDLLYLPGGGSRNPASKESIENGLHYMKMKGSESFKVAVRTLEEVAREALMANDLKPSDIDLFIPHQANLRIIQAITKRLDIPMDKVIINIDRYGNTSAASIPIALDEVVREGRVKEGDLILMDAFGGGLTWASALIRW